jgi:hypothetical protein
MHFENLPADWSNLAICGIVVLAFTVWGVHSWLRKRPTPVELERLRRGLIEAVGKMGDGAVIEIEGSSVIYSYDVRGVEYTASQDLSALEQNLPEDRWALMGPVTVKYDPRNPANSIILAERWTGLRKTSAKLEQ